MESGVAPGSENLKRDLHGCGGDASHELSFQREVRPQFQYCNWTTLSVRKKGALGLCPTDADPADHEADEGLRCFCFLSTLRASDQAGLPVIFTNPFGMGLISQQ